MRQLQMLVGAINVMLEQMDEECAEVRMAMGVRPNLEAAKERIREADTTIRQLAELLDAANKRGITHPPDVLQRVRDRYRELTRAAQEVYDCEIMLAARQALTAHCPAALN